MRKYYYPKSPKVGVWNASHTSHSRVPIRRHYCGVFCFLLVFFFLHFYWRSRGAVGNLRWPWRYIRVTDYYLSGPRIFIFSFRSFWLVCFRVPSQWRSRVSLLSCLFYCIRSSNLSTSFRNKVSILFWLWRQLIIDFIFFWVLPIDCRLCSQRRRRRTDKANTSPSNFWTFFLRLLFARQARPLLC